QKHCHYRRKLKNGREETQRVKARNHEEALRIAISKLLEDKAIEKLSEIKKVGHRVVHGGEHFTKPTRVNKKILKTLGELNELAPLHNPANLAALKASSKWLPRSEQFAVFDTGFHSTLPQRAFLYGLPFKLYKKEGIRRFGFHGISHEYVSKEALKKLKKKSARLITCHLGNGVSLAAIKDGKSLDTSMGFTPLEGPLMGTRSGTIDPALIFHLVNKKRTLADVKHLLEKESGFKGMSEIGSDIRQLWARPRSEGTLRTFDLFSYQIAKIIGSYMVPLGGAPDAVVFTAGVGENAFYLREQICAYFKAFGLELDHAKNRNNEELISKKSSKIKVLVIKTHEELEIARKIQKL
ncbi:MAG: acetate/propionate family kinase, partial [Patescibacteria group bacterium]